MLLAKICTEKANWRIGRLGGRGDDLKIKSFDNPLAGAASSCATPVSVTSRVTTALPIRHGEGRPIAAMLVAQNQ